MKRSLDERIEELSAEVGGRFKLTTLIIKRMREYYIGGRTFLPDVDSQDELFALILDQIENEEIVLSLPEKKAPETDGG